MRIDPTVGPRAEIYAHFRRFTDPWFTICARVPVQLPKHERFGGMLWSVLHATQQVPELRERIVVTPEGEWVQRSETVDCTCTVALGSAFVFCPIPWQRDRAAFLRDLPGHVQAAKARGRLLPAGPPRLDLIYLSTLPWVDLSSIQHAQSGDPDDSVPRILWGRIQQDHVTVCVTANHALVDGRHTARFFSALERSLAPERPRAG